MLESLLRTLVKVAVASLIVGTILAHFGITIDLLVKETGFSTQHVEDLVRRGLAWAMPKSCRLLCHFRGGSSPAARPPGTEEER